jgi:hypothetical protein
MSDTLSFTEIDAQHVELLPSRTVLSMMFTRPHGGSSANGGNGTGVGVGGTNVNTQLNNVGVFTVGDHNNIGGSQHSYQSANGTGVGVGGPGGIAAGHGPASANGGNGTGIGIGGINVNTQLNNVGVVTLGDHNNIGGNQSSYQSANGTGVGVGGPGGFAISRH